MALPDQQQNFISELSEWAENQLNLLDKAHRLVSRWNQNDMFNQMVDADVTEKFSHLTKSEIVEAINAVNAVRTALGTLTDGQAVNLVKLKG